MAVEVKPRPYPRVKVNINEVGQGSVSINGAEVKGVLGIDVRGRSTEVTTVTLHMYGQLELDAAANVTVVQYKEGERPEDGEGS